MAAHGVVSDAEAALFVGQVEDHVHPGPVLLGPGCISALGALLEQRIRDLAVDVLLLEAILVADGNLAIEVLEPRRLAEAQELIVDEAVVHAVELVDIVDDGQALILHKILNKRVSAEGNTEPLIPLRSETLNMEQVGGKVREGRVCLHNCVGSVERVLRRNTLDQERGLVELKFEARVFLEHLLNVR